MIEVPPESQTDEDGIPTVNHSVSVSAVLCPIKFRQRDESVGISRWRLFCKVTEQFLPIVYASPVDLVSFEWSRSRRDSGEATLIQR